MCAYLLRMCTLLGTLCLCVCVCELHVMYVKVYVYVYMCTYMYVMYVQYVQCLSWVPTTKKGSVSGVRQNIKAISDSTE